MLIVPAQILVDLPPTAINLPIMVINLPIMVIDAGR
jgi:hypothetical protein